MQGFWTHEQVAAHFKLDQRIGSFPLGDQARIKARTDQFFDRLTGSRMTAEMDWAAHEACAAYLDAEAARALGDAEAATEALARMEQHALACRQHGNADAITRIESMECGHA